MAEAGAEAEEVARGRGERQRAIDRKGDDDRKQRRLIADAQHQKTRKDCDAEHTCTAYLLTPAAGHIADGVQGRVQESGRLQVAALRRGKDLPAAGGRAARSCTALPAAWPPRAPATMRREG
eukprot:759068-Hanusia_phi.AAC.1